MDTSTILASALIDVNNLREELLEALSQSTAVEALVILPLIERAAQLRADIAALRSARDAELSPAPQIKVVITNLKE